MIIPDYSFPNSQDRGAVFIVSFLLELMVPIFQKENIEKKQLKFSKSHSEKNYV